MTGRAARKGFPRSGARVAGAAVALVAVIACVRGSASQALQAPASLRPYWAAIGAGAEVVLAILLYAARRAGWRAGGQFRLAAQLRSLLRTAITGLLVAVPVALGAIFLSRAHVRSTHPPQQHLGRRGPRLPPIRSGSGTGFQAPVVLLILGALVLAGLVALAVWGVLHRRGRATPQAGPPQAGDWPGDAQEDLGRAVASGQVALNEVDDARAAIIACYQAMERSLAQAGEERGAADTPDELLARAARRGLTRSGAGGTLTALFYEARYSSRAVPPDRRAAAASALSELAAELGQASAGAAR